jgi:hypothetical protein
MIGSQQHPHATEAFLELCFAGRDVTSGHCRAMLQLPTRAIVLLAMLDCLSTGLANGGGMTRTRYISEHLVATTHE